MDLIQRFLARSVEVVWGPPLIILVVGGGLFLSLYARFLPILRVGHALKILRGSYDDHEAPGQISHFQALSTALASTIGVGNIGGVAVAITQGGPGAVFWMWVAAAVGMATKFFSCTLAVMFRGRDSLGRLQGGPMYYMEVGLGPRFRILAICFALCGLVGCLPMFQGNQMAEILLEVYQIPPWLTGVAAAAVVVTVTWGGVERIGQVASRLVPGMFLLYVFSCLWVVGANLELVPRVLSRIFVDAFTGTAASGGAAGVGVATVIRVGIRRAAFSNEAGLGTAPLAHGAARTREPVREGLIAMLGPFIDTIVVCTLTAFVILSSGLWTLREVRGVSLTGRAFEAAMGRPGTAVLTAAVILFGVSTMIGYSYYGRKCFAYLFGAQRQRHYDVLYLGGLLLGAMWTAESAVNLIDTAFALMALPNMIATLLLAPRVMEATRRYFGRFP